MAQKKFKTTPFARFFVFLIFFTPLAYVGASYYNGQDGIQNIKNLIGIGATDTQEQVINEAPSKKNADVSEEFINGKVERLSALIKQLEEKNNELHLENKSLREEIKASQQETQAIKDQLKAIKDAVGG